MRPLGALLAGLLVACGPQRNLSAFFSFEDSLQGWAGTVVVDTPDALLVCPRDRAQEVKSLVEALKNKGAGNLC